jgi:quinoprotein glucose dehydrogenase
MPPTVRTSVVVLVVLSLGLSAGACTSSSEASSSAALPTTANGDWPHYAADLAGTRYSPLDQIDASNFNDLEVAWRLKTDNLGTRPEYKLEGTPLAINGILYTTAGTRRAVIAIDGRSGELLWVHRYPEGKRGAAAPRQLSGRGLSYWTDGQGDDRVLYVTPGYRLIALDAETGQMIPTFGDNGMVDLKVGAVYGEEEQIDLETGEIGVHSTPTVAGNTVIVGSSMKEGMTVTTSNNTKGSVRAYDARTGDLKWTFNTIPRPGEFGAETWQNGSWAINGNAGVWTQISVDQELGIVYLPVETPTSDFFGAKRPGENLFGESLVAVDLNTGERKWHFQFVHHPLWNYDMSSAPILADVTIDGTPRKVVAVPSKQAWLYVFDRVTGEPIWPIEEKEVPKGDVPGEWYSPTQPHVTDALHYARNAFRVADVIDFTPALRAEAMKRLERYVWYENVVYNPPIVGNVDGKLGAILMGNSGGGTNWPGGGYDPETGIVYAPAAQTISSLSLAPPPPGFSDLALQAGVVGQPFQLRTAAGTGTYADAEDEEEEDDDGPSTPAAPAPAGSAAARPAARGGGGDGAALNIDGLSVMKPPYGVLSAIDLKVGRVAWKVAHGETPDNVRNHAALRGKNIPRTGQNGWVGPVVTKTLVVLGDPQFTTTEDRGRGAMLRAYDKATGAEVGEVYMPAPQSGSPMTYMANGKQYIVVAVSGGPYSGEYIAYALPDR